MTITKGNIIYEGVKEVNGELCCEKCGGTEMEIITHIDGKDYYTNTGECIKCGNAINIVVKRANNTHFYEEGDE